MVTSNIDAHMRRVCCIKKNRFFKKKQKYSKGEMCVLAAGQDEWRTSAVVFIFFGQHSGARRRRRCRFGLDLFSLLCLRINPDEREKEKREFVLYI
jgi:endonuclease III